MGLVNPVRTECSHRTRSHMVNVWILQEQKVLEK